MANLINYTASYNAITALRSVCQFTEWLLFSKEEELTASGHDEYQVFCEVKQILYKHMLSDDPHNFGRLNDGNTSIENLHQNIQKESSQKMFAQRISDCTEGLASTLERLAAVSEEQLIEHFVRLCQKYAYPGPYNLGCLVYRAIEEAATLLQTMDRLSSAEKQKTPTESTLEDWFPNDPEKWIRFIGEQLARRTGKQGRFVALLLHGLHQADKMDAACNNPDRRKTLAGLQRALCNKFPGKIASEQAIQKYYAPMYNKNDNSQYKLYDDEVADMKKTIQKYK